MVRNPWYGARDLSELCRNARRQLPGSISFLSSYELFEVLVESVTESVIEAWCTTEQQRKEYKSTTGPSELALRLHSEINPRVCSSIPDTDDTDSVFRNLLPYLRPQCDEFRETAKYGDRKHPFLRCISLSLIKHSTRTQWTDRNEGILLILATVPVVPDIQSVAISHATSQEVGRHQSRLPDSRVGASSAAVVPGSCGAETVERRQAVGRPLAV